MAKKAVLTEYSVSGANADSVINIAHISDLHERRAEDILALTQAAKPDLIVVTGDTFERYFCEENKSGVKPDYNIIRRAVVNVIYYVNNFLMLTIGRSNAPETENAYDFLSRAAKIAPVYLSLGNHEESLGEEDIRFLKEHRITLLDNADVCVSVKGARLRIGGLSSEYDEHWLSRFAQKDGYKLLLCHHPEYYEPLVREKAIDLTLAGHNHGGQIKLFGRGVIAAEKKLFPKYDSGFFENRFIVSAGCANTAAIPRWNNPRELVLIHLQ